MVDQSAHTSSGAECLQLLRQAEGQQEEEEGAAKTGATAFREKRPHISFSMHITQWTGCLGGKKRSVGPKKRTSRFFCPWGTRHVTGKNQFVEVHVQSVFVLGATVPVSLWSLRVVMNVD